MFGPGNSHRAVGSLAAVLAGAAMLVAACSSSSTPAASSSASATSSTAPLSSAASAASSKASSAASSAGAAVSSKSSSAGSAVAAAGAAQVGTTSGTLGTFLVDGKGMTLYMFDTDETAPGTSTCYDACAKAWPPLITSGQPTATGSAAGDKLTTITRTDGSTQVVYGEYPLYTWAKDTAPGQTTGQGVGGTWWVVGVDGEPIKTPSG